MTEEADGDAPGTVEEGDGGLVLTALAMWETLELNLS